jgi:hypothetical protein
VYYAGIFVIALATLLFELSLIRVLSFTIWHHFAYVVISTALLGYGASGTLLAVRPSLGRRNVAKSLAILSVFASATCIGVLIFISAVPLDPMVILEKGDQAAIFVGYQIVAAVPFFFSGLCICLLLREAADRVDRLYFWDLSGAALGCIIAVALMNVLTPPGATIASGAMFALAGLVFARSTPARAGILVLAVVLMLSTGFAPRIPLTLAPSKEYALLVEYIGSKPIFSKWTALFRTDVVEDARKAPGQMKLVGMSTSVSKAFRGPPYLVSHDGTAGTGIDVLDENGRIDYLDFHLFKAPYLISNPNPRVMVIGVGGGRDVVVAMQYGASHVTGVELDPVTIDFLKHEVDDVTHGFFRRPEIELVAGEGRHFVRSSDEPFDVIQLTGVDTLAATNSGAYVLAENYLYTVDAFVDYLDRLTPGGILTLAMANMNPNEPRAIGRVVSVAHEALRRRGVENPGEHIAVLDSRNFYAEVMIQTTPFRPEQVETLAQLATDLDFLPLYLPGRKSHPLYAGLATATGEDREQLLAKQRFLLTATTDDNPFFLSFFRWSGLFKPGLLIPSHASALGQIVLGLLVLTLTVLGAIFILVPLVVFRWRGIAAGDASRFGVLAYFLAIGLGFMLFEISLIQKFVLFLGYPTYSLSVTLCSLLVSLGCGSYLSQRWVGRERTVLPLGVLGVGLLAVFYTVGLPPIQNTMLGAPLLARIALTVTVLFPLGLCMGMFFPLGIRIASAVHEDMVPWAWGINGCASVTAGVGAVVLAMRFGFSTVWLLSLAIYALGVAVLLATMPRQSPRTT